VSGLWWINSNYDTTTSVSSYMLQRTAADNKKHTRTHRAWARITGSDKHKKKKIFSFAHVTSTKADSLANMELKT
jgi:hypothetical protein